MPLGFRVASGPNRWEDLCGNRGGNWLTSSAKPRPRKTRWHRRESGLAMPVRSAHLAADSTFHVSRFTPLLRLLPESLHHGAHPLDALARVLVGAAAFEGDYAVPAMLVQVGHAGADVVGVDAAADGDLGAADAGFLAAHGGRQRRADILDVAMADVGAQGFEVIERVVAGDEGVAGVEVALEVFGLEVLEEVVHELEVVGVGTVRLDVDDDLVVLGPREALAVIVAGDAEDFLAREAGYLKCPVHRIDHRAAHLRGEADG